MANPDRQLFGLFRREQQVGPESRLYGDALALYHAWHVAEGRNRSIIDFDLTQPQPFIVHMSELTLASPSRAERDRIVEKLTSLHAEASQVPQDQVRHPHYWEFFRAQVEASLWFARRLRGDELDPMAYIEKTMGVKPELIPEETLKEQKNIVLDLLRELGISDPGEKAINAFKKDRQINPEVALEDLRRSSDRAILRVGAFLGESIEVRYRVVPENVNQYWWVWVATNPETSRDPQAPDFLMTQNFFKASQRIWTNGKAEEMGPHEGGQHLRRMAKRKALIKDGKMDPIFGLTTVHGPEQVVEEGLAQTLVLFLPGFYESLSTEGKFQVRATILRNMVYGNLHLRVNHPGYNPDEVIEYVHHYLPWEPQEEITRQIEWRTKRPLYQTYLWAYGEGARRHLKYATLLNERGRKVFLQNIFSRPYTPEQEKTLVECILGDPRNRAN